MLSWIRTVILRFIMNVVLSVLLIAQSAVPCCAISTLIANGEAQGITPTVEHACKCGSHSVQTPARHPANDKTPVGKCPFCGKYLIHFTSDKVTVPSRDYDFLMGAVCEKVASREVASEPPSARQTDFCNPILCVSIHLLI